VVRARFPDDAAFADHLPWLQGIAEYLEKLWDKRVAVSVDELRALPPEEQLTRFVSAAKAAGIAQFRAPTEVQLRRVLSVYKANMRALIDYRPNRYPGALALLQAEGSRDWSAQAREGWSKLAASVEAHSVAGDHYTLVAPPNAGQLASLIGRLLDRAARENR
jgi:thioesterase domain-containing protein